MENVEKYITQLAQDLTKLSPRQRRKKSENGEAQYLYSLLGAGVTVNFVEYLCGTLDEMHQQFLTRIRQKRFQTAKRKGHFSNAHTHCRVCGARLMRKGDGGQLVETQTSFKHRAFCRGGECKNAFIATKPVHRVVKLSSVPQPVLPTTPIEYRDLLSDDLTVNREGVKKIRKPQSAGRTHHAKDTRRRRRRSVMGAIFAMVPGKAGVTQPPPAPPIQRYAPSSKAACYFSFGQLEAEDIRE